MKTTTITMVAVLALAFSASGALAALGTETAIDRDIPTLTVTTSDGENGGCLDFLALWAVDGVHSPTGDSERIDEVTVGADWTATSDDGSVFVDFYNEDGAYIIGTADGGEVPTGAAYAYGCVTAGGTWPDAPIPAATFTYDEA